MSLIYRFKKEKLESGQYVSRPRIFIVLEGENSSIEVPALIDSGCDVTVIPEGIAKALGLNLKGKRDKIYGFRESTNVIQSKANMAFMGKNPRDTARLSKIPVLVAVAEKEDEEDVTLGIQGIFDYFDITFKKTQNQITLKRTQVRNLFKH